jgi:hypothetical protein
MSTLPCARGRNVVTPLPLVLSFLAGDWAASGAACGTYLVTPFEVAGPLDSGLPVARGMDDDEDRGV